MSSTRPLRPQSVLRPRWWAAMLAAFAMALAMIFATPAARAADEAPALATPRDTPLILDPKTLTIPPLLADMTATDHGWLHLAYQKSVEERALALVGNADSFKDDLSAALGQAVLEHVEVRIARSPEDMDALAPVGAPPQRYATGVAYPALHLILISLRAPRTAEAPDLAEVLRHELVHVALQDATAGQHVPAWFNEGLAVHLSGESSITRLRTLWDATLSHSILPLSDLDKSFPTENYEVSIAYAESADFVRFLLRGEDRARFGSLVERVRKGTPFDRALADAYGTDTRKLEYEWREELTKRYSFWPVLTGSSMLWALIIGVMALAWLRRRRKAKETLRRWEREEAEERRLRERLAAAASEEEEPLAVRPVSGVPAVEHDGRWHILH